MLPIVFTISIIIIQNKTMKDDIITRRDFFKQAVQKTLPILMGTSLLPSILACRKDDPVLEGNLNGGFGNNNGGGNTDSGNTGGGNSCVGCGSSCSQSCAKDCYNTCRTGCDITCKGLCQQSCVGGCDMSCLTSCRGYCKIVNK